MVIELDEEQHFNRYRLLTLESPLYERMPAFPLADDRSHCKLHERDCLRKASNRGYWSNDSTLKQFGPASVVGDLSGYGSPRWKQRAFYDFLNDLAPQITGTAVARISIWDTVDVDGTRRRVLELLDRSVRAGVPVLVELIEHRSDMQLACNQSRNTYPERFLTEPGT